MTDYDIISAIFVAIAFIISYDLTRRVGTADWTDMSDGSLKFITYFMIIFFFICFFAVNYLLRFLFSFFVSAPFEIFIFSF